MSSRRGTTMAFPTAFITAALGIRDRGRGCCLWAEGRVQVLDVCECVYIDKDFNDDLVRDDTSFSNFNWLKRTTVYLVRS